MSHQISDDAISRSRRIRESRRAELGGIEHTTSIIGQSKSNASLRSIMSVVKLMKNPRQPSPDTARQHAKKHLSENATRRHTTYTPAKFEDAEAAIEFLEREFSRTQPEWLRATSAISVELSVKTSEVSRLGRKCESLLSQLKDQSDAEAVQRKLVACELELEESLDQSRRSLETSKSLKDELSNLHSKHKRQVNDLEEGLRRLQSENVKLQSQLRQKDLELDRALSRQMSLEKDIEQAMLSARETEESCRDAVSKTKQAVEEERDRVGRTQQELNETRSISRREREEHSFAIASKDRQVDILKEDLRQKTLKTAARALARMCRYSTWRAFAKMKGMVHVRKAAQMQNQEESVSAYERQIQTLTDKTQTMEITVARLEEKNSDFLQRESNMLNIISWLLDLHSSGEGNEEEKRHNEAFLQELRSVYETAKGGFSTSIG